MGKEMKDKPTFNWEPDNGFYVVEKDGKRIYFNTNRDEFIRITGYMTHQMGTKLL